MRDVWADDRDDVNDEAGAVAPLAALELLCADRSGRGPPPSMVALRFFRDGRLSKIRSIELPDREGWSVPSLVSELLDICIACEDANAEMDSVCDSVALFVASRGPYSLAVRLPDGLFAEASDEGGPRAVRLPLRTVRGPIQLPPPRVSPLLCSLGEVLLDPPD